MAVRIKLMLAVLGAVLIWLGIQEQRLRNVAKPAAQDLACARLGAEGPGDNAHIRLKEFLHCEFAYVYAEKNGAWEGAYVPAVPQGGAYHERVAELLATYGEQAQIPMPTDISVLVFLKAARNEGDVERAGQSDALQGLVINEIESLEGDAKKMLKESYPAVDFSKCWILEVGRRPAGAGKLFGLFGGGGLCFLVLGLWWLFARMGSDGRIDRNPYRFEPEHVGSKEELPSLR